MKPIIPKRPNMPSQAKVEREDSPVQIKPAEKHQDSNGTVPEDEETARRYREAAEQGDTKAQVILGELYENGQGIVQDYKQAMKWYRRAAKQGNSKVQVCLGTLYRFDRPRAYKTGRRIAINWYRKAADQGDARGFYELGAEYEDWIRRTRDDVRGWKGHKRSVRLYKQAMTYYRKAAELGDTQAQRRMGCMLSNGMSSYKDFIDGNLWEAHEWYIKAAKMGSSGAAFELAFLFISGRIFAPPRDYMEALKWCIISQALSANPDEINKDIHMFQVMGIDQELSSSQFGEAERLAQKWLDDFS